MTKTKDELDEDKALRNALFAPCESKEHLHRWIQVYLGLNLPDTIVDPESNSCPLDLAWEVYHKALEGSDEDFSRVMVFASRDSYKTLLAAILEVLSVLHLGRDVAHMAAIKPQAQKAQGYVRDFFRLPYLREFVVSANTEKTEISWYRHKKTGECIPVDRFAAIQDPAEKSQFIENRRYIKIVVCTLAGSNSDHVPFFCVDGFTEILIKNDCGGNRDRVRRTARGIFERLAGRSAGGRPGGEKVEEVLEPKERIEVLSMDLDTGELQFQPIVRAQRHHRDTLRVAFDGDFIVVTPDHPLFVYGKGYVQAGQIQLGDRLLKLGRGKTATKGLTARTGFRDNDSIEDGCPWEQMVLGSLLGDCGIYKKPQNNPYLQEQHAVEQDQYLSWKREVLSRKLRTVDIDPVSGYTGDRMVGFRSGCSPLLLPYLNVRESPASFISKLTGLGLAVWYMDDGCAGNGFRLSTEGFDHSTNELLAQALKERFGFQLEVGQYERDGKVYYYLHGGIDAKRRLVELAGPHVHPSMAYKFDLSTNMGVCQYCGVNYWFYEAGSSAKNCGSALCQKLQLGSYKLATVTSIEPAGERWVYDFTLPASHNFFGNGVLNHQCVDEVDVVPKQNQQAYEEAKSIPAQYGDKEPITLLTSTRKFAFGNVQRELDAAAKTGLVVRHWNIIDVTQRCPTTRHLPNEPIDIWINKDELTSISDQEYQTLPQEKRSKYEKRTGYAGCLKNCKLFAMCGGALATRQKEHPVDSRGRFIARPPPLLKSLKFTTNKFRELTLDMAKAQLLCWKASREGLIYTHLDPEKHLIPPSRAAKLMLGGDEPVSFGYSNLIALMLERDGRWYAGIDFGFTHNFSVVLLYVDRSMVYVVGHWSQPELDPAEKVDLLDRTIEPFDPTIYADPEAPDMIKFLKKHGHRCKDWTKGPGSVLAGIERVRYKLMPGIASVPQLYFINDAPGVQQLFDQMALYHWALGPDGKPTDVPDEIIATAEDGEKILDDGCDAIRYAIMNIFANKGGVVAPDDVDMKVPDYQKVRSIQEAQKAQQAAWAKQIMEHVVGSNGEKLEDSPSKKGRKGNFFWDFG
jgi:hypothetical protein